jgi:hypothetical protein
MRHATDPVPDVMAARPDAPVRVAAAVDRALAKDAADRFPSMDAFVDELVASRNELPAPDSAQTMILPEKQVQQAARVQAPRARRRGRLLVPLVLLLLLLAAAGAGAYYVWHQNDTDSSGQTGGTPPATTPVHLAAFGAYDPPPGDGVERNDLLQNATDGDPATAWQTERYTTADFGNLKDGVGLVLSAGTTPVQLKSLTVHTPTPGFEAVIKASNGDGPWEVVSSPQAVHDGTTFSLDVPGQRSRYMIWITKLVQFDTGDPGKPYGAQISEVTAGR